jgi:hypothetical protein
MPITPEGQRQMTELDARRTAHLRGEREWYEDPGRFGPRAIGAIAELAPGLEAWTTEDGRRNRHGEPLGGIILHVDPGAPPTVDEWGELHPHPALIRVYDPLAPWPDKAFRTLTEDEVNRDTVAVSSDRSTGLAIRKFCREVGHGKGAVDLFEAHLVTDAARLVAVLMGGR